MGKGREGDREVDRGVEEREDGAAPEQSSHPPVPGWGML